MYSALFERLARELSDITSLPVELEPEVATPREPHLRIKPKSPTREGGFLFLNFEVWFIAFGGGKRMLDIVLDYSVKLSGVLTRLNIEVGKGAGFGVVFEKLQDGEFFENEGEGRREYVWVEKWKGAIVVRGDIGL